MVYINCKIFFKIIKKFDNFGDMTRDRNRGVTNEVHFLRRPSQLNKQSVMDGLISIVEKQNICNGYTTIRHGWTEYIYIYDLS